MLKKLLSRKFIVSLITTICGILGMINVANDSISLIFSMLMVIVPNVIYIITEGKIDRVRVKTIIDEISQALSDDTQI